MFVVLFITAICVVIAIRLLVVFQVPIQFFMMGQDKGFKFNEVMLLWKLAKEAEIAEPMQLFVSVPTLNMAISKISLDAKTNGTENSSETQDFLEKLYDYRTKIDLDHDNKKGLESTKYLETGQRLRIILKGEKPGEGKGIFASEILNNGHDLIIRLPLQKNVRTLEGKEWVTRDVSVYLWRKGDAGYVFDTRVVNEGIFQGQSVIYLAHTNQMERAQKRKSVRSACKITAQLYFISTEEPDFAAVEVDPGYKCLLEDISEDGAMIRIGGKGRQNIKIKIQFELDDRLIIMFGVVRAVEFNESSNESRLHFECLHIEKEMKNAIFAFIYRDMSEEKKNELEALAEVEQEEQEEKIQEMKEELSKSAEERLDEAMDEQPPVNVEFEETKVPAETVPLPADDTEKIEKTEISENTDSKNEVAGFEVVS